MLRHKRTQIHWWAGHEIATKPQPGSALACWAEFMLPACGVLATDAVCTSCSAGALKAQASSQTVSSTSAEGPLPVLLQQNLARVLVRAGRLQEAVGVYERLQAEGEQPHCALHSALH